MSTKAPRERLIATLQFSSGSFDEIISPNAFPLEIYEHLLLRLTGTHNKTHSGAGVSVGENPFTLFNVRVSVTGQDFIDITGTDLRVLSHFIQRDPRNKGDAIFTPSVETSANTPFSCDLLLPFILTDMVGPRRGFFRNSRYKSSRVRVDWGSVADLLTGGTYSVNAIVNCQMQLIGKTWTGEPAIENAPLPGQPPFMLHRRSTIIVPTNGVALDKYRIEIPRDPSWLRGILLKTYTSAPETGISTLFANSDVIQLVYNKNDIKLDTTWGALRSENQRVYGNALPTGYVWLDLAPDGDWNTLQDTSSGVYEVVMSSTNAVANSKIRMVSVRYAPGL